MKINNKYCTHGVNAFRLVFILLVAFGAISFPSCTEKIDIELDDSYTRLVVDGAITTDTLRHTIKLSRSSSYFYNEPAPVVENAVVSISDGENLFSLTETSPGTYQTDDGVFGIPGRIYTLNIQLKEPLGNHSEYTASSTLYGVSELDSVGLLFHPEWGREGIWEVKCYVQEPPTVDYYRFLIYKNMQLLSDSIPEWFVIDDKLFNGSYTNGASVGYLSQGNPNEGLRPGDVVTVEVNNIGEDYINFIWEVQSEVRGSNPLFTGPPANVKGNISNGAIGFFAAYSTTRKSAVVPFF